MAIIGVPLEGLRLRSTKALYNYVVGDNYFFSI